MATSRPAATLARLALLAGLALSCAGTESAAPAASEALYSASARDYGFDFDAHVWEVESRPQLSIVRSCVHPAGVNWQKVFFCIGCNGELTRLRGFEHAWTMRSRLTECRLDPAEKDREFVLGFTLQRDPSELPPDVHDEFGPVDIQSDSAAAANLELARRQLGRWPSSPPGR